MKEFQPIKEGNTDIALSPIKVKKLNQEAILPRKSRDSDIGYDIYILSEDKEKRVVQKLDGNIWAVTVFYRTGISVTPPNGYYFQLLPRSSFSKQVGWQANSIGIIEDEYTGEWIIPVKMLVHCGLEFNLSFYIDRLLLAPGTRHFQMVPQLKLPNFQVLEVDELQETDRGASGFGSTGN